jgi:hypothetical protein
MKFDAWIQSIKLRGKWKLDAIAMSVFLIARHVHDHQKKLAMSGRASTDSKIIALVLMYRYYITEINRAELERQLQNAAAEKSLQQQQTTSKETKALPVNFCCDLSKVSFFVPDLFCRQVISMVSSSFLAASSSPLGRSIQLSFLRMCGVGHFPDRRRRSTKTEGGIHRRVPAETEAVRGGRWDDHQEASQDQLPAAAVRVLLPHDAHVSWRLNALQQHVRLSARLLASGRDVRDATNVDPRKKGKRHDRNSLR